VPEQEKYPIPDIEHARNALARVAQHGSEAGISARLAVVTLSRSDRPSGVRETSTARLSASERARTTKPLRFNRSHESRMKTAAAQAL
jgi:hypothetical protein